MLVMVKAVPHSNSVYSNAEIKKILSNYDLEYYDRCQDDPNNSEFNVDGLIFPYEGERALKVWQAEQAMRYIAVICRKYPFNLRRDFAVPMWLRFSAAWNDTGDIRKAMRAI